MGACACVSGWVKPAMKPRYQVSRSAIELIKRFEGYRRKAAQLDDGRWTIGYGHVLTAREGAEVSEQDAEALLMYDLIAVAHSVNEWIYTPLSQNQFDALSAFAFNIGLDNFRRSSVLRRLNEGALIQAACAMELWRKAEFEGERIVVDALVRRRSAEKTLFLTPAKGFIPAPSPLLRPRLDIDATGVVPRQTPTALIASLEGPRAIVQRDLANQEDKAPFDDDAQSAAAAAAAAVTARLQTIFSDDEAENVRPAAETAAPAPRLVLEEITPPGPAPFPHTLAQDLERAFALTPPVEELAEPPVTPEPEAAVEEVEAEPTLFEQAEPETAPEVPEIELPEVEAPIEVPAEIEPEIEPEPAPEIETPVQPEPARQAFLPALALAIAGVALFAGCLVWAINAPAPGGAGAFNPGTVVWLAGIAGVGLIGVAVYLLLDRLGRPGPAETGDDRS